MATLRAVAVVGALLASVGSCTHDFGSFEVVDEAAGGTSEEMGEDAGKAAADASMGGSTDAAGGSPAVDGAAGSGGALATGGSDAGPTDAGGTGGFVDATPPRVGEDGSISCPADRKLCDESCVLFTDPGAGCGESTCDPCALDRATATCENRACVIDNCEEGFWDCNGEADDGCESALDTVDHCGGCDRKCDTTGVASQSCNGGVCDSSCEAGRANCAQPASGPDDGCEVDTTADDENCGGCGNSCTSQNAFQCVDGACACTTDNQCWTGGLSLGIACQTSSGLCTCSIGGGTCNPGEQCSGISCTCNGGASCPSGETCCQTPAGCFDLESDAQHCGGCGRACPTGFICVAGACECDADSDCSAGAAGECTDDGACECGTSICGGDQRCVAEDTCG